MPCRSCGTSARGCSHALSSTATDSGPQSTLQGTPPTTCVDLTYGVGSEPAAIDQKMGTIPGDCAPMGLGFEKEDSPVWPDHNMIEVAVAKRHVIQNEIAIQE